MVFKRICVLVAGILTVSAMLTAYFSVRDDTRERDRLHRRAEDVTRACDPLGQSLFEYAEAKRNRLLAYGSDLSLSDGDRNRYFKKLLAGSTAESFIDMASSLAMDVETCEAQLPEQPAPEAATRTAAADVATAARALPEAALGAKASEQEIEKARTAVDRFVLVDGELASRSATALLAARQTHQTVLEAATVLSEEIDGRQHLAWMLQLAATLVLLAKDLLD
ncbi:MAG: hypothetical protein QNJ82_05015 [Gammaproteobacteria bacterium]|nr:hypothetical protein [Gammaproteobacteria bacterium]